MKIDVIRRYLELPREAALIPARTPAAAVQLTPLIECDVPTWRRLYHQVGYPWHWHDRDAWSDDQLAAHLARPSVRLYTVQYAAPDAPQHPAPPAGFVELERGMDDAVEIVYLGLAPHAVGQGLGGWLVTAAARAAFAWGASRVWLHTCTLDHPAALPNYRKRGFILQRTETYETTLTH